MTGTQKAIIPGIFIISLLLYFLNSLVNPSSVAVAATEPPSSSAKDSAAFPQTNSNSECASQSRYPEKVRGWCLLIETTSAEYGLDPLLIAAVMLIESGGQPEVISRSGAVGLMQVMPRDGIATSFQCINGPCFANRPSIADLLDPEFNVDYGTRMLSGLINKTGDVREALKSYGPYDVGYDYADKVLTIYAGL